MIGGLFNAPKSLQTVGNQAIGQTDIKKSKMSVCSKPILALWSPASCAVARPAPLLFRGPSAIISPWAAKPALFGLLLRLPGRVERPSCLVSLDIQGLQGSWPSICPAPLPPFLGPSWAQKKSADRADAPVSTCPIIRAPLAGPSRLKMLCFPLK